MVMKESIGSLRAFFIVIGLLGLFNLFSVVNPEQRLQLGAFPLLISLLDILLSAAYLYVGISLPRLLTRSPNTVINIIFVSTGLAIISFLLMLTTQFKAFGFVSLAITLAINWYLYNSVKRLPKESPSR